MSSGPRIQGLGFAQPQHSLNAAGGLRLAERLTPGVPAERLERLYETCGVKTRATHVTAQDLLQQAELESGRGATTGTRLASYTQAAAQLASRAAAEALKASGTTEDEITHLVTVSCTGASSPGIDRALFDTLRLDASVSRTHIGFMGCHGAINALRVASALATGPTPGAVLVVCVELCSLHYQMGDVPMDQVVANAIFADGAAAAVIRGGAGARGPRIDHFGSAVLPKTRELMSWNVTDHGYAMGLSPRVPVVLRRTIGDWTAAWLNERGLDAASTGGWVVHPGGKDILEACERGLALPPVALRDSRAVLSEHGNMSSGTVLWVLDRMLHSGASGPIAMLAFGPGLCIEAALLHA